MQYQQVGDYSYMIRLQSGEPVIETLTAFLRRIEAGFAGMSAFGAVEWAELAYWNSDTEQYEYRKFEEQMEVVSLGGNCSLKEGEPFLHVHCVLSRHDYSVLGGHLTEARVRPTLEVLLQTGPSQVRRTQDVDSGLYLLDLADKPPQVDDSR